MGVQQWDAAIALFNRAIAKEPRLASNFTILYNRGLCHFSKRDCPAAIADFDQAIARACAVEGKAMGYTNRSHVYRAMGRIVEAARDLETAVQTDPNSATAHNNLAWFLATCFDPAYRNGEKAVEHALKANESGSGHLAFVGTLAAAYAEAGNFPEAIKYAQKFLDSNPPQENVAPAQARLQLYQQGLPYREEKGTTEMVNEKRAEV